MHLNPYLSFKGQCEAAFKYYERLMGAKILFMTTWGESPMKDQFPELHNQIMHATLAIGDARLMGADPPPDRYEKPQGISVSLNLKDKAEAKRIFDGLAEGGTVQMPFQETFWAAGFGMCEDRFGIPWMVNCENAE